MFAPVIYNPPIRRNGVECTAIALGERELKFVFHFTGTLEDLNTMEGIAKRTSMRHDMVRYLELEGYIPPNQNWKIAQALILHKPTETLQ